MIKDKNLGTAHIILKSSGVNTAATGKDSAFVPFNGFISNIIACCASGGTGATNSIIDVNYIGTTIFGAATKITFASTTGVASYSALSSDPYSVTAGATFALDVDSISTNLKGVHVDITISKSNPGTCTNLTDMDTIM